MQVLEEFLESKKIQFWAFINHFPDEDDLKEHFHVYVEPFATLDTVPFNDSFVEVVPGSKPLKCLAWRSSKFSDWYMYCLHDSEYLLYKGLKRNLTYAQDDFIVSDFDEFNHLVHSFDRSAIIGYKALFDHARSGINVADAIDIGVIPYSQMARLVPLYNSILYGARFSQIEKRKYNRKDD